MKNMKKIHEVMGGVFGPRKPGEQISPNDLPIIQAGAVCGRVFVTSTKEFWITYTADDANGTYSKYKAIKDGNAITFLSGDTPELLYAHDVIYNRASDPNAFAAYRNKLPAHACVEWATSTVSGLPSGAPGTAYKLFQGNGQNNVWVGYAVLDTLEQHWVLFSQNGNNGENKFTWISQSTVGSNGNLSFTAASLPGSVNVTYEHIKCLGTSVP